MPLPRLVTLNLVAVALLLLGLVASGFLYNRHAAEYKKIVDQGEEIIFTYTTVREQATEALLLGNQQHLLAAAAQFDKLHSLYTSLLENNLFPSSYKLTLLKEIDLVGLVIAMRQLPAGLADDSLNVAVVEKLRQINDQFMAFDRIVVSEIKDRVMGYQKMVLVFSGLLICLLAYTVITIHHRLIRPMVEFSEGLSRDDVDPSDLIVPPHVSAELVGLLQAWRNSLAPSPGEISATEALSGRHREEEFAAMVNEVTNHLNGIINYSQLLADYCESQGLRGEAQELVAKIISEGEHAADILQKRLQGGNIHDRSGEERRTAI